MYYQPDWENVKKRFRAFWEQEIEDRILIQATAKKSASEFGKHFSDSWWVSFPTVKKWAAQGYDHDFLLDEMESRMDSTHFAGDSLPRFFVNLGPGSIAAYLGCDAVFMDDTVWFDNPFLQDWDDIDSLAIDPEEELWCVTKDLTRRAIERGAGRYLVTMFDLVGVTDLIPWLRGTEQFCIDLLEAPDQIKRLRDRLTQIYLQCYTECCEIITPHQEGCMGSLPAWSPGKTYFLACDISSLFSPEVFRDIVVPEITEIARFLDDPLYHLDGIDAARHLDHILGVKEIKAIQFSPGAGGPKAVDCIPMFKGIQQAGKSVFFWAPPGDIETVIEQLSPKGLCLQTSCATPEEADDLVKKVATWTARRLRYSLLD